MPLRPVLFTLIAAVAALVLALPASAAPDNKNTTSFPVSCDGIEDGEVFVNAQNSSDVVFLASGQVLVAKLITADQMTTFTVEGGPTFTFPDSFQKGANGSGFEDRLMSCDFTAVFEDQFTADKRFVEHFELDSSFIGATVNVSTTITGTAEVMMPGSH